MYTKYTHCQLILYKTANKHGFAINNLTLLAQLPVMMYNFVMHNSNSRLHLHRQVNIRLTDGLFTELSRRAETTTTSVSQLIREAVIQFLDDGKK